MLDAILRPRSIAVIGASRNPRTIGHQIVANLVDHGFTGPVYPVNPSASSIHSLPAWREIEALPEVVDLAVVVVPHAAVLDVVERCGARGVKGLVVISAGFREVGGKGSEREERLMEVVRRHGMRMVGPNCMGVLNTDPAISMNATFAPVMPPAGRAAFVSQSGALGVNVLDYAREFGIGISQFVSVGNKPDVSGNDVLLAWESDPTVELILMYVESFGNPQNFLRIAGRITRTKPIIVVKSGRSATGARAASSHTGALGASDAMIDAMLAQAGVLRAGSIEELFDMAVAFSSPRRPRSRSVAVVTNAGGPGILAADAIEATGLQMGELAPATVERLRPLFPPEASLRNPLDMIASATPAGYRAALGALLADPGVDAAVAIFVPPLGVRQEEIAEAIVDGAATAPDKPVISVLMGREGLPAGRAWLHRAGIPAYIFPESAARGLRALAFQQERMERPVEEPPSIEVCRTRADAIIERCPGGKMGELDALSLLHCYGITTPQTRLVRSGAEAAEAVREMGGRVVMKVVAGSVIHKSDVGGVRVGISAEEASRAYDEIESSVRKRSGGGEIEGMLVQEMVRGGREVIVGGVRDESFGPAVMFGLGGLFVEALGDVLFRFPPFGRTEARMMVDGIRGARLLDALRGEPAVDREALADLLLRAGQMLLDQPRILELDVNPVIARSNDAIAVDARVILAPREADDDTD